MTLVTILIITLTNGEIIAYEFNSQLECSEALLVAPEAVADAGYELDMAQCFATVAPGATPRPKRRPEPI